MKHINFLIKPSSSKCDLKCKYCFYHDIADNRMVKDYGYMSSETSINLVRSAFEYSDGGNVTFAFQGGEPTLIGLDYYKDFIKVVGEHKGKSKVHYAIQTNGMTLNEEWCRFFSENQFLVGLSMDSTKEIHDVNRVNYIGKGTHKQVMGAARMLNEFNVAFNILTVVTRNVVRRVNSVYGFYKKQGFKYLQFIPCLDPLNEETENYSLSVNDYSKFLKSLFDLWYKDMMNGDVVSIRYFDNILGMYMGREPESCDMMGRCSVQHVVEGDGSVYPCDFYVLDDYLIGNINEHSIDELHQSEIVKDFITESFYFADDCKQCKWLKLCRGGCKRNQDDNQLNFYCEAYKEFFEYSNIRFMEIAKKYR